MSWEPISLGELNDLIEKELQDCGEQARIFFNQTRLPPAKWASNPYGNLGGGFWVVAIYQSKVLWYNDIEDGFNVSRYIQFGVIPDEEYWCNQDPLEFALIRLSEGSVKLNE
ncbi:hypothetical protein [Planctomicrobium piriforme]|uniref:Uncharacterized protein n=1 Tax=Planctomicrobium piriforme TaxID=1576369 RepID=A0A1I3E630_9PLAN|nr:hypothetical protein [Planctomicrobium piriforme]SFH94329.1 hypothetical protein SAMN05421753_10492 [Planctomicrobium piriforme]